MPLKTCHYVPDYPLNQFVEFFFYYSGYHPAHDIDRLMPDGEVRLLFDLSDQTQPIYDNNTVKVIQVCRKAWLSGFRTQPITIPSGRDSEMLIVQFRKGRAVPFIDVPMSALTNLVVDADLVVGREILVTRERLIEARAIRQKFDLLEKELLDRYLSRFEVCPFVDFAISRIVDEPDQCRIREIATCVGYTQKHLIDLFKHHLGVTPKSFLRVARFQRAIQYIECRKFVNWVDVANECGFYDQSHFISDFRGFSGLTPTEYLVRKGEIMNYVPVGNVHDGIAGGSASG